MNTPRRVSRAGATLGLLFATGTCTELPMGIDGKTTLTLTIVTHSELWIGDTTVVLVEARDPLGRLVATPPVIWETHMDGAVGTVSVARSAADTLWVVGATPGAVGFEASIPRPNPTFEAAVARAESTVRYGPMEVLFTTPNPDLTITTLGRFSIPYSIQFYRDRVPYNGDPEIRHSSNGPVLPDYATPDQWVMYADHQGVDTLVLSHTACFEPCEDTLVVRIAQVPAYLNVESEHHRATSLGQQIALRATVRDTAGFPIESAALVWRLVNPADSSVAVVDSVGGSAVARTEGEVLVSATHAGIEGLGHISVRQEVARVELAGMSPYLAGVGTRDTVRARAFDGLDNPITITPARAPSWSSGESGVAMFVSEAPAEAVIETIGLGEATISYDIEVCYAYPNCYSQRHRSPLRVLPEPDSVRIVSDWGTTIRGIGSWGYVYGDVYLPAETLERIPLLWTSLDPAVATIDDDGLVTTYSLGTARLVGHMGTAADTVTITIIP